MNQNLCSLAILILVVLLLIGCGSPQKDATLPKNQSHVSDFQNARPVKPDPDQRMENTSPKENRPVGDIPDPRVFTPYEIAPKPIFNPQPEYPDKAKRDGVKGKVFIQIYVDENGDVREWEIVKVLPEGLGFEEEVIRVVQKWKFTPAIQNGKPVGVWIAIPFNFGF